MGPKNRCWRQTLHSNSTSIKTPLCATSTTFNTFGNQNMPSISCTSSFLMLSPLHLPAFQSNSQLTKEHLPCFFSPSPSYPHCLHFLTLLQHKSFRDHLAKQDTATFVHERQYYHWQYLRNQDKVVRMEYMPDGSLQEIKNEGTSSEFAPGANSRGMFVTGSEGQPMSSTIVPGVVMGAPNGSIAPPS